nr:two-component response regulator ARR22-like [Ipomoea trifida]
MLLKKYGLDAQVAKNGYKAMVLHHFDLLLMEKEMPVKDGVNATWELREMGLKSMIVGVTLHGPGEVRDEFMVAGLDECLMKPLGSDVVLRLINQLKYRLEAQVAKKGEEAVVLHCFDLLLMDKEMPVKDGVNVTISTVDARFCICLLYVFENPSMHNSISALYVYSKNVSLSLHLDGKHRNGHQANVVGVSTTSIPHLLKSI